MSLYLKYRPQDFDNLIGQDHIKITLKNALKQNKISHAYLFCGPRGTGKTTTARLVAKAINCANPTENFEPCNECNICKASLEGSLIDLIEIDAASNRGIDEIRDLREKIRFAPSQAKAKVYIIDEVHMLTKEAFNALLKTLEEPPAHAYFILATTETHKVPATIISRCQKFDFRRISIDDLVARLKYIAENENIKYEENALEYIAKTVKGGLRDAISIFDQLSTEGSINLEKVKQNLGLSDDSAIKDLFIGLMTDDAQKSLLIIDQIFHQGVDLIEFTREFLEYTRFQMLDRVNNKNNFDLNKILKIIEEFSNAKNKIAGSVIAQLPLEIAILNICAQPVMITNILPQNPKNNVIQKLSEDKGSESKSELKVANISDIIDSWSEILNKIDSPVLKQTVKQAKIEKGQNFDIILNFDSQFHYDKFNTTKNIFLVEQIIKELLNTNCKINCFFNKISDPKTNFKENAEVSTANINDQATSIFGGEW